MTDYDKQNIVLTGFMATGKSTIGRLLAKRLRRSFIDVDDMIVAYAGKSITDIFAQDGEAAFRQMETEAARFLSRQSALVIATGGGTMVNLANREVLSATGFVVCLTASPEVIEVRIARKPGRPLAGDWRNLLEARREAYDALPHQVDTDDIEPEQVIERILALWQRR